MYASVALACVFILVVTPSLNAFTFDIRRPRLAIDYGPRTIGIAVGNIFGRVQPHGTIKNTGNLSQITADILSLANSWSASEIVVGVPVDADGELHYGVENFNGQLCLNFSKVMSSICSHKSKGQIKAILFDERFTTMEATLRLKHSSVVGTEITDKQFTMQRTNTLPRFLPQRALTRCLLRAC